MYNKKKGYEITKEDNIFLSSLLKTPGIEKDCRRALYFARKANRKVVVRVVKDILEWIVSNAPKEGEYNVSRGCNIIANFIQIFHTNPRYILVLKYMIDKYNLERKHLCIYLLYLHGAFKNTSEINYFIKDYKRIDELVSFVLKSISFLDNGKYAELFKPKNVSIFLRNAPISAIIPNKAWFFEHLDIFIDSISQSLFDFFVSNKMEEKERISRIFTELLELSEILKAEGLDDKGFLQKYITLIREYNVIWDKSRSHLCLKFKFLAYNTARAKIAKNLKLRVWKDMYDMFMSIVQRSYGAYTNSVEQIADIFLYGFKSDEEDILSIVTMIKTIQDYSITNKFPVLNMGGTTRIALLIKDTRKMVSEKDPEKIAYLSVILYYWNVILGKSNSQPLKCLLNKLATRDRTYLKNFVIFLGIYIRKRELAIRSEKWLLEYIKDRAEKYEIFYRLISKIVSNITEDQWKSIENALMVVSDNSTSLLNNVIYGLLSKINFSLNEQILLTMKSLINYLENKSTCTLACVLSLLFKRDAIESNPQHMKYLIDFWEELSQEIGKKYGIKKIPARIDSLAYSLYEIARKFRNHKGMLKVLVYKILIDSPTVEDFSNKITTIAQFNEELRKALGALNKEDIDLISKLIDAGIMPDRLIFEYAKEHGVDKIKNKLAKLKRHVWNVLENVDSKRELFLLAELFTQTYTQNDSVFNDKGSILRVLEWVYDNRAVLPLGKKLFEPFTIEVNRVTTKKSNNEEMEYISGIVKRYIPREDIELSFEDLLELQKKYDAKSIYEDELIGAYVTYLKGADDYARSVISKINDATWLYVLLNDVIPDYVIKKIRSDIDRIHYLQALFAEKYKSYALDWSSYDALVNSIRLAMQEKLEKRNRGFRKQVESLGKLLNIVQLKLDTLEKDKSKVMALLQNRKSLMKEEKVTFLLMSHKSIWDVFAGKISSDSTTIAPDKFMESFMKNAWNVKLIREDTNKWIGNLYILELEKYLVIDALQIPFADYFDRVMLWEKLIKALKRIAESKGKELFVSSFLSNFAELKNAFKVASIKRKEFRIPNFPKEFSHFESYRSNGRGWIIKEG